MNKQEYKEYMRLQREKVRDGNMSEMELLEHRYKIANGFDTTSKRMEVNQLINLRAATKAELERVKADPNIGNKKMGPAVAGVIDRQTGKIYFGLNHPKGEVPENRHPHIESRTNSMPKEGIHEDYKLMTKNGVPGTHAEVYALNDGLNNRPNSKPEDFMIYVVHTSNNKFGLPMPRCPH